jgi:uncharacterized tellurite resistance protein B-like protein
MIKSLQGLIRQVLGSEPGEAGGRQRGLNLISAALMLEVARADFREDASETEHILAMLKQAFSLTEAEAMALVDQAGAEVDVSVSLYEFTRLINDELGDEEKRLVIKLMWEVAYADDVLHRYEEHLVRKVAELTYVPAAEVLRLRFEAEQQSLARRGEGKQ